MFAKIIKKLFFHPLLVEHGSFISENTACFKYQSFKNAFQKRIIAPLQFKKHDPISCMEVHYYFFTISSNQILILLCGAYVFRSFLLPKVPKGHPKKLRDAQEVTRVPLGGRTRAPRSPQGVPKEPPRAPKELQGTPKSTQEVPRRSQERPTKPQGAPKMPPRPPKEPKGIPKRPQGARTHAYARRMYVHAPPKKHTPCVHSFWPGASWSLLGSTWGTCARGTWDKGN